MNSDKFRFIMGRALAVHDRSKFTVFGYSPEPLPKEMFEVFDVVRGTAAVTDADFVDLVHNDELDVLVEMTGLLPGNRFAAMSNRCAPVQISYLNHTSTSGVPNIDYILTDEICVPVNSSASRFFTEKIIRLAGCYMCFDYDCPGVNSPPVSAPPLLRRTAVTFGCFGAGSKINTKLIERWANLLHRVPGSNFYIRNAQLSHPSNRQYMTDRFLQFGIGSERLEIDGGLDRMALLRAYANVDVALDTWPCCSGNTVAEALWQGVPVVTYLGDRFSSRYGASIVTAAGCPELIARSVEDYIEIAANLARDPTRLVFYRQNLRRMCKEHGLGDTARFVQTLEQAYVRMVSDGTLALARATEVAG